jgi:tetrahedral aminopeptidase
MKELIKKLVETPSPSGFEAQIRDLIRSELEDIGESVRVDPLGSLIVELGSSNQNGKKIMIAAHMDEIGVIVTHIDENGFLRFTSIGYVSPETCIGSRVRFLSGQEGIIHREKTDEPRYLPGLDQLFIDIGATSREDVSLRIGDVAAFERPFLDLGDRIVAKSMDDRIAVAVMIAALRKIVSEDIQLANHLVFAFTVQEEVGVRGAAAAAYGIDPDLGLAIDVTRTGDTPKGLKMDVRLGKGPAIKIRDSGMIADPRIVNWMISTAEEAGIPYQLEVLEAGSTDARAIQLTRAGIPAGCLSIPCRYIHSPSEMVDFRDVNQAVDLLVQLLRNPVEI